MTNLLAMVFTGGLLVGLSACWIGSRIGRWRRKLAYQRDLAEFTGDIALDNDYPILREFKRVSADDFRHSRNFRKLGPGEEWQA